MINSIKMDIYRMVRTKSFYTVLFSMMIAIAFTTYLEFVVDKNEDFLEEREIAAENAKNPEPETINFGMSVNVATKRGEKVSVYNMFYANTQGKFTVLFLVIFTVIFTMADITSGYVKNIAGQIKERWLLILSKSFIVFLYTFFLLLTFVFWQAICNWIFMGYLVWGDGKIFLLYFFTQLLLHFAFAMVCMTIAILIKNQVGSMTISICLCMNLMVIVYGVIDKAVQNLGKKDFSCMFYTLTGKMSMLPQNLTGKDSIEAIIISIIFASVSIFIASAVFEKRDI